MDRVLPLGISSLFLLIVLAGTAFGGQPHYLVLKTDQGQPGSHYAPPVPMATAETRVAQPYAYGWFGAQPRRHWTRHFGYYRNYTEWSGK